MPKKILILSVNFGQGHMSAAKAIQQAINHLYPNDYEVEVVDFVQFCNSLFNTITQKTYNRVSSSSPTIWKLIFKGTNRNLSMKVLNQLNTPFFVRKLTHLFTEKKPDIVISTFPVMDPIARKILKKMNKDLKFISVITDSMLVHKAWVMAKPDFHIVANQETANTLSKDLGIQKTKIKTLGFPVKLEFMEPTNNAEFLKNLGLEPEKFTILFLPTAQKNKKNIQFMEQIMALKMPVNCIVITGRDPKIKPALEKFLKRHTNPNIQTQIIGWTDQMPEFIKTADIVITKAGGATVMECIAAQKPMIITSYIPGQEEGNVLLIERHKIGIIDKSPQKLNEHIESIQKNYHQFQGNLQKISHPDAALKIARFIAKMLE